MGDVGETGDAGEVTGRGGAEIEFAVEDFGSDEATTFDDPASDSESPFAAAVVDFAEDNKTSEVDPDPTEPEAEGAEPASYAPADPAEVAEAEAFAKAERPAAEADDAEAPPNPCELDGGAASCSLQSSMTEILLDWGRLSVPYS